MPAEVVVVDQSSTAADALAAHPSVPGCDVRYLHRPSKGVGRARNVGIAAARHDLLAFIDDDVIVTDTWLERIVAVLLDLPERSVVTARVDAGEPEVADALTLSVLSRQRLGSDTERLLVFEGRLDWDPLFTNAWATRRSAIDEVGLFDERFGPGGRYGAASDNDFGHRLLEAGYRIVLVKDAVAIHRAWRPRSDVLRVSWRYGRGQGAFYSKHARATKAFTARRMAGDIRWHVLRLVRVLPRNPRRSLADVLYVAGLVAGAGEWLLRDRPRASHDARRT